MKKETERWLKERGLTERKIIPSLQIHDTKDEYLRLSGFIEEKGDLVIDDETKIQTIDDHIVALWVDNITRTIRNANVCSMIGQFPLSVECFIDNYDKFIKDPDPDFYEEIINMIKKKKSDEIRDRYNKRKNEYEHFIKALEGSLDLAVENRESQLSDQISDLLLRSGQLEYIHDRLYEEAMKLLKEREYLSDQYDVIKNMDDII